MCAELQCAISQLFILTPNGQHGNGDNRSAYTLRPSVAPAQLAEYAFFGKLLGCAMLQRELIFDLDLSEHVWKALAGVALTDFDLALYDSAALSSLRQLKHIERDGIDETSFGDLFFEAFETVLSDGSMIELIEDGAATDVTFATRGRYADLAIAARLAEGSASYEAILAGIGSLVPSARLMSLMTGAELSLLVCGESVVDLAALRAHTTYGATASANMQHVRFFWQVDMPPALPLTLRTWHLAAGTRHLAPHAFDFKRTKTSYLHTLILLCTANLFAPSLVVPRIWGTAGPRSLHTGGAPALPQVHLGAQPTTLHGGRLGRATHEDPHAREKGRRLFSPCSLPFAPTFPCPHL